MKNLISVQNELFTKNDFHNTHGIKRIVILGHSGFIGSHLEKALECLSPEIELIGYSLPDFDLIKQEGIERLMDLFDMETAVIMCAAIKRQFGDTLEAFEQNINMTMNLCRLLTTQPVKRFIFFSSSAVYGEDIHNTDITEETSVHPTSYYGMAKYSSECLYRRIIDRQMQSLMVILRPPLIYGPGDLGKTYGPSGFAKAVLNNEMITLWGDGTELREFIFVEDIVRVVCNLLDSQYCGVVNVASGKSHMFRDVLEIISSLTGRKPRINSRARTKDKVDNAFRNERFMELMNDFQFTSLKEGIRRTVEMESDENGMGGQ